MIKKIVLVSLFIVFAGVLVAGGVYRTTAKSTNESRQQTHSTAALLDGDDIAQQPRAGQDGERQGQGLGSGGSFQGRNRKTDVEAGSAPSGGQGAQGGQGRGQQGIGSLEAEGHELVTIEGTVTQAPAAGVDMIVSTSSGEVMVGTGPGYLQQMGFELREGETVEVEGFWEDGEFKAESITRDGEVIALRDEFGRPMWSGAARGQSGQGNQGSGRQARDGSARADL